MKAIDNIRNSVKEGNSCLFLLFVVFNFLIFLSSLGILGCGVYLFVITKEANTFNISFLVTGALMLLFSTLAFKLRKSVHLLCFYLLILFIVFLFQLVITIVMIIKKEALVDLAKKYMGDSDKSIQEVEKFEEEINTSVLSVSYALIAFLFGYCYRSSTQSKTIKHRENLMDKQRYSDQVKECEKLVQLNNDKRVMYEQKYPELAKHRKVNSVQ
ncbi:UNKNOWN [Stylonychia lemnae]|uniref:Tetraspanin family protein n=1 Tax=Stylonychia lemnae TaxID=5949 RepID=A0A078AG18_STYLE|nr:UNKNOWN [Stylonychia lemnae]|eukprot:CDW80801.1 UNKNOWN [Stylonychia lemnae]